MMIVMKENASKEQIESVASKVESIGARAHISEGDVLTVIGAIGDTEQVAKLELDAAPGVDHVVPISKPYKLSSLQFKKGEKSIIDIDGHKIGGGHFGIIGGPCTVESLDQTIETAKACLDAGVTMLRGGAFKPRTSPYSFQGLGSEGLQILAKAKEETGLPIVTELMSIRDVDEVVEVADVIQIGARNMQNYNLLTEIGKTGKAALLKRGLSGTLEELLMAAEYILKEGTTDVMLCERGIRTYEPATRFTLDILAIPVLQGLTHLPVVVDPSHAAGRRDLVPPVSLAAAAAGADGIIVEAHPDPESALCDGPQALPTSEFAEYVEQVNRVAKLVGKTVKEK